MGKPAASPMPGHLRGRATKRGPMAGGYVMWSVTVDNVANNETPEYDFVAPCDMRMEEISFGAEVVVDDPVMSVVIGAQSLVAAVNITTTPTVATLVAAGRDISKGDLIRVNIAADAGDTITGLTILLTAYTLGHVQTLPAND